MYYFPRRVLVAACLTASVLSVSTTRVAFGKYTQTTTTRDGNTTITTSVGTSLYEPEPALASLLKGRADQIEGAAAWLSGCAKAMQASAAANLANAQAGETLEKARTEALTAHSKATTTFFERRKLYETYRELAAGPPQPKKRGAGAPPAQAPGDELVEPRSGRIHWPAALMLGDMLEARMQLETLFAARSRTGIRISSEARAAIEQIRGQLRQQIRQVAPSDYAAAKRFLDALGREAQRRLPAAVMAGQ